MIVIKEIYYLMLLITCYRMILKPFCSKGPNYDNTILQAIWSSIEKARKIMLMVKIPNRYKIV